jgi:hypothetical protein
VGRYTWAALELLAGRALGGDHKSTLAEKDPLQGVEAILMALAKAVKVKDFAASGVRFGDGN